MGGRDDEVTFIKICGITNLDDALVAVANGADALGFNFYERSPRYIEPAAARRIIDNLPGKVTAIGVFVNKPPDIVESVTVTVGLDAVQLHGEETENDIALIKARTGKPIIKAFRISPDFTIETIDESSADAVLLDSFSATEHGGTGIVADWSIAKTVVQRGRRVYLAGGLSPDNVASAIQSVRPYAVDACSQLESKKGRKNHEKVRQFIANAKVIYE